MVRGERPDGVIEMTISEIRQRALEDNTKADVEVITQFKLTSQQLLFVKFIWLKLTESLYCYLDISVFDENIKNKISREEINEMYEKGLLLNRWEKEDNFPDLIELSEEFAIHLSKIYGFKEDQIEKVNKQRKRYYQIALEFWEAYPKIIETSTGDFNAKRLSKGFRYKGELYYERNDLFSIYLQQINYNEELHKEIINNLKNPEIRKTFGFTLIGDFVVDAAWESFENKQNVNWLGMSNE